MIAYDSLTSEFHVFSCRNCLFRALGDQLEGHSRGHLRLRQETVQYMTSHRRDFEPFVEDDVPFAQHGKRTHEFVFFSLVIWLQMFNVFVFCSQC